MFPISGWPGGIWTSRMLVGSLICHPGQWYSQRFPLQTGRVFFIREILLFSLWVCVYVFVYDSVLVFQGQDFSSFLTFWLRGGWAHLSAITHLLLFNISSSPLVVELTTLVSTLVVKLLVLGVFTLRLPAVFGIYLSSVQMSGCGKAGETVGREFCGEKPENSVVVNKPVNFFLESNIWIQLYDCFPKSQVVVHIKS